MKSDRRRHGNDVNYVAQKSAKRKNSGQSRLVGLYDSFASGGGGGWGERMTLSTAYKQGAPKSKFPPNDQ